MASVDSECSRYVSEAFEQQRSLGEGLQVSENKGSKHETFN